MIVAITLSDGQQVGLSADHIVLLSPTETADRTEVTLINGKKFILEGNVLGLTYKFNTCRK